MRISVNLKFDPEKMSVMLIVEKKDALNPEQKRGIAEALRLHVKDEFHITIAGKDTGKILGRKVKLRNKFYHIKKEYPDPEATVPEKRTSIIQMVKVKGLKKFYKKLNRLSKNNFPVPPPHITLYTTSTKAANKLKGIGIYSQAELDALQPKRI